MIKELVIIKAIGKTLGRLPDNDAKIRVIDYVKNALLAREPVNVDNK